MKPVTSEVVHIKRSDTEFMGGSQPALLFLLMVLLAVAAGCTSATPPSTCVSCHKGLEAVSSAHSDCVACHGGDPKVHNKGRSHASLRSSANPSSPESWEETCGRCHRYQLERVKSTIMQTNAGMIRNIQLTWEGEDGKSYTTTGGKGFDPSGKPVESAPVEELDNLSGELYRKFCSRCHIGTANSDSYAAAHASGCAACHFPWNDTATYEGGDKSHEGKGRTFRQPCHDAAAGYAGLFPLPQPQRPDRPLLPGAVRRQQRPGADQGGRSRAGDDQRRPQPDPYHPRCSFCRRHGMHRLPHLAGCHGGRLCLPEHVPADRDRLRGLPRQRHGAAALP